MWEVIIQNIGSIYKGEDEAKARQIYSDWIYLSIHAEGRVRGAGVDLYREGLILISYVPSLLCATCGQHYVVDELGVATHLDAECHPNNAVDQDHTPHAFAVS